MAQKKKTKAMVVSQKKLADGIYDLRLETELAQDAACGQFVGVYPKDKSTLLPRPISICEIDKEKNQLRLVYRVAGKGTAEFSNLKTGDSVYLLGVLGNGFPVDKAKPGTKISFGDGLLMGEVLDVVDEGNRLIKFTYDGIFEEILDQLGEMPLPPYITHKLKDKNRYQTVYAKNEGSAAAPTAGLHFTPELLEKVKEMGVNIAHVTLHVGLGTFRPVKVDDVEKHHMHSEFYIVEEDQAKLINDTKKNGGRVISVGTTSCRTLESATGEDGIVKAGSGWTEIFIYPGYKFKAIDGLITNFHLPESTLLMLVSALAGKEHIMAAYEEAVKERYRFFSFGDAMMIE